MLLDEMIHESNTFDLKIPLFQIASNEATPIPQLFRQKQPHFELFLPLVFFIFFFLLKIGFLLLKCKLHLRWMSLNIYQPSLWVNLVSFPNSSKRNKATDRKE